MARKKIAFGVGLFVLLGIIYLPGLIKLQQLKVQNKDLEDQISILQQDNKDLEEEKIKLEQDLTYIEKVAREKLGVIRKGETLYRIVNKEDTKN